MTQPPELDPAPELVRRYIRANTTGVLTDNDLVEPVKYVLDAEGHPVAPMPRIAIEGRNTVLFVPDESHDGLELMVTLEEMDLESAQGDRWQIYHGKPNHPRLARLFVEAAKYADSVFEGEAVIGPNPLATDEPALCRELNQDDKDKLAGLCDFYAHTEVTKPVAVGVDHLGLDVRAAFGIVRVPLIRRPQDAKDARAILQEMIHASSSPSSEGGAA